MPPAKKGRGSKIATAVTSTKQATANDLSPEAWTRVLTHLGFSDLNRARRINKTILEISKQARPIQEALFSASFDRASLESRFESGDKFEIHPALYQIFYHLTKTPSYMERGYHPRKIEELLLGRFKLEGYNDKVLSKIAQQNITNPPVQRVKFLGKVWDLAELRKETDKLNDDDGGFIGKETGSDTTSAIKVRDILNALAYQFKSRDGYKPIKWTALPLSADLEAEWEAEDEEADDAFSKKLNRSFGYGGGSNFKARISEGDKREKQKEKHRKRFIKERSEYGGEVIFHQAQTKATTSKSKGKSFPALFQTGTGDLAADLDHLRFADAKKAKNPLFS